VFTVALPIAKDLICHLLVKDAKKRYTAQQCWENRWVQGLGAGDNLLQLITGKVRFSYFIWYLGRPLLSELTMERAEECFP